MRETNKWVIIAALICTTVHLSEQSFLWDILNQGRALFSEERYPSARILRSNMKETHDDGAYEKPTHRENDSSDRFTPNLYDRKRQHEFSQYPHSSPSEIQPYKESEGYYGKYVYSQAKYPNSLNFYSFLGGLSFASLLATTFIVLSRRNGSLFRTLDDDDSYIRNFKKKNLHWDEVVQIPKTFLKLIDNSDYLWPENEKQEDTTMKKSNQ